MKILITGADGFIGSHLTESLVRAGHDVRAFTYYNSFGSWGWLDSLSTDILGKFEVVMGDIRDESCVRKAMLNCDAVCHLAALIAIPFSYSSPASYVETNIKGTLNILQAARDLEVQKVVHTSTSEVYGTARYVPIDEAHPLQAQSPYSASKIGADQLAYSFYSSFNTPVVIIRPFNTYGPRQSARAVIPSTIIQIAVGNKVVKLGSASPTRDFSYIDDTVDGFIAALSSNSSCGQVINLGSGFEVSVGEVVKMINDLYGKKIEIVSDDVRFRPAGSEVERLWSNNQKAKKILKWSPQYAGLDGLKVGLQKTIEWFNRPQNLVKYKADIYNL